MKISNLNNLNKAARAFLMENYISKKGYPVRVLGFTGYINSNNVDNVSIERTVKGGWIVCHTEEQILSLAGEIGCFSLIFNS